MKILKKYLLFSTLFCLPLWNLAAASTEEIKRQMKGDLDTIRSTFALQYAPAEWKKSYLGWDLDREIDLAKEKVDHMEKISTRAFQHILRDFFNSTRDYHVSIIFYSTETATLPFSIKGTNGKYFISYIDHDHLSYSAFPFSVGDEIVSFDGKPIHTAVLEFQKKEWGSEDAGSDRIFASEVFFTKRFAARGHTVPKGSVSVGVKKGGKGDPVFVQLMWDYKPEKVTNNHSTKPSVAKLHNSKKMTLPSEIFYKKMIAPFFETMQLANQLNDEDERDDGRDENSLGARKSFVPELGEIWWESEPTNHFHAYIYETEDRKRIGYIRIPHYGGIFGGAQDFAELIKLFEKRTDALVIDQVNNPGGYVLYCYGLLSMLADRPLATPKHRMAISPMEIVQALELIPILESIQTEADVISALGNNIFGYPLNLQTVKFILAHLNFLIDEWRAGKTITDPYHTMGPDQINPNPDATYTKPILMLINQLDISGGDFVPAILQDNGRATLFGTRTSGAGGYVYSAPLSSRFGVASFSYTASIAERVNCEPIENLGVSPDIEYQLTEDDLRYGYEDYKEAINEAVLSLINHQKLPPKTHSVKREDPEPESGEEVVFITR